MRYDFALNTLQLSLLTQNLPRKFNFSESSKKNFFLKIFDLRLYALKIFQECLLPQNLSQFYFHKSSK